MGNFEASRFPWSITAVTSGGKIDGWLTSTAIAGFAYHKNVCG
jgi:hypothetical protein